MNRFIRYSCMWVFCFISCMAYAQELPVIQTDRPDQTECPYVVPAGYLQGEMGFNYQKTNGEEESLLLPTVLWRYGINENFEFRLITELQEEKTPAGTVRGLNPIRVGFKAILCKEKGIVPQTGFIGHLILPGLASQDFACDYYAATFRFVMSHTLSSKVSLSYNLGAEWDGFTPDPTFIYTLTSGISLTEKLGCYGEFYGFFPQLGKPDQRADAGVTWFIKKNLMLDVSGGIGITPNAPDYYGSLGFSFRLPR